MKVINEPVLFEYKLTKNLTICYNFLIIFFHGNGPKSQSSDPFEDMPR